MRRRGQFPGDYVADAVYFNYYFLSTFYFDYGNFVYQNFSGASFRAFCNGNPDDAAESDINRFGAVFDVIYYVSDLIPYQ